MTYHLSTVESVQWGLIGTNENGDATIIFPVNFKNIVYAVSCNEYNAKAWNLSDGFAVPGISFYNGNAYSIQIRSIWVKPGNTIMFGGESIGYFAIGQ